MLQRKHRHPRFKGKEHWRVKRATSGVASRFGLARLRLKNDAGRYLQAQQVHASSGTLGH